MKLFKGKNAKHLLLVIIFSVVVIALEVTQFLGVYWNQILFLALINIILALSLNLINGFTGMFSLGHAGFMAIGAYTVGILTMPTSAKEMFFINEPMHPALLHLHTPFVVALLIGMMLAALIGFLIAVPILRLTDDYLAIATLGFAEIIRLLITIAAPITNGPLGLRSIPRHASLYWAGGAALVTLLFMIFFTESSHGKALQAIRENEIAAESVGINLFRHKVMSFTIGSAFAGLGGGLMAGLIGTINPLQFAFAITFNILLIVVLGGMGRIWGNVVAAVVVTFGLELLRRLDEPINLGFFKTEGLPGLRMVVFALILILVILFKNDPDGSLIDRFRRRRDAKN